MRALLAVTILYAMLLRRLPAAAMLRRYYFDAGYFIVSFTVAAVAYVTPCLPPTLVILPTLI